MDRTRQAVRLLVVTVSDRALAGSDADLSGPQAVTIAGEFLEARGYRVTTETRLVPGDQARIERVLAGAVAAGCDLVLTTGRTGIEPEDVTPEATRAVVTREIPGVMEAVRGRTCDRRPAALLSRAVAGVAESTLIFNLPGDPQAVQECLAVILPVIPHALAVIRGSDQPQRVDEGSRR